MGPGICDPHQLAHTLSNLPLTDNGYFLAANSRVGRSVMEFFQQLRLAGSSRHLVSPVKGLHTLADVAGNMTTTWGHLASCRGVANNRRRGSRIGTILPGLSELAARFGRRFKPVPLS